MRARLAGPRAAAGILLVSMAASCRAAEAPTPAASESESPIPAGATARLGTPRPLRGGAIRSVCFSPDGRSVAGGGALGAWLWDARTGRIVRQFSVEAVGSVGFAEDGRTPTASADSEGAAALGDFGKRIEPSPAGGIGAALEAEWGPRTLRLHGRPICVASSPAGDRRAFGFRDDSIALRNGGVLLGHRGDVNALAFSPDGEILASGSADEGMVLLWASSRGEPIRPLAKPVDGVHALAFSPDGRTLATGEDDLRVRLWRVPDGTEIRAMRGTTSASYGPSSVRWHGLAFSPDGKFLAAGSLDDNVRIWDLSTREKTIVLGGHEDPVAALAFSPDGKVLATGSFDGTARVWNPATGATRAVLRAASGVGVRSVAFTPDGACLVTMDEEGRARAWDIAAAKEIESLAKPAGGKDPVRPRPLAETPVFSPDEKMFAGLVGPAELRIKDAATGATVASIQVPSEILGLAFSFDGRLLATAHADRTILLWNAPKPEP